MAWNPEDMATLERLWLERSASQIGALLKMTRNMVIGKARRMKLPAKLPGYGGGKKGPRAKSSRGRAEALDRSDGERSPLKGSIPGSKDDWNEVGVAPGPREAVPNGGLHIIELEHHHCRYIVGQCADGSARYCGQQKSAWRHPRSRVVMPVSYCKTHADLCYTS